MRTPRMVLAILGSVAIAFAVAGVPGVTVERAAAHIVGGEYSLEVSGSESGGVITLDIAFYQSRYNMRINIVITNRKRVRFYYGDQRLQ